MNINQRFLLLQKRLKRWKLRFTITKRQIFVGTMLILTGGVLATQLVSIEFRYFLIAGLALLAFLLSAFSLREDLKGTEWLTLLVLPMLFTLGTSMFYFLLPGRWLTRIVFLGFYAVGIYALLLTENIFNVAANRTIALLRVAHSIGFLFTLITYFFLVHTILSFRLSPVLNMFFIALASFFLILQSLWAMELEERVGKRVWRLTCAITVVLTQLGWVFNFWPVNRTLVALLLTTIFYSSVGTGQQYIMEKLYKKSIGEFFLVTIIVFILVMLATRWRGFV